MYDPRHEELARLLIEHSLKLRPGEKCLIETRDVPEAMVEDLIAAIYGAGAVPVVRMTTAAVTRALFQGATDESVDFLTSLESDAMKRFDAYIGMTATINDREMGALTSDETDRYRRRYLQPVHYRIRIPETRWVVLRYPTPTMAYMAGMSLRAFTNFFYRVTVGVDYRRMADAMARAIEHFSTVDRVHITGPGTDLAFSVAGLPRIPCAGEMNIPDGEIYTAPIRDSVNGTITYNTPSTYGGTTFTNVRLRFESGRIVESSSNRSDDLARVLDTDDGARYVGEFALGCNPEITEPMDNTLFDEKIAGSFHFTPGNAYEDCDNGNRSSVHWDLVSIQRPEYGGGEIWFDDQCIRRDGEFIHPAYTALNRGER